MMKKKKVLTHEWKVDSLPRYAKAYILPRVMKKESIEARLRKDDPASSDPMNRWQFLKTFFVLRHSRKG
jgi:hypothetical protein